ncbi:MAG: ammonia channel protein, partial [Gammaproteobacteria bacterium]
RTLKLDDSLDVFPVHGIGGIIGLLLTGIFSAASWGGVGLDDGVSMGGHIWIQFVGILATAVWCGVASFVLLKLINVVVPLRVSAEDETEGLDIILHEESGYNL